MVEKHRSPKAHRPRLVALAALVALLALGLVGAAPAWAAVPTVEAVTPSEGPEAGGTPVVIKGTGFEEPATVTFNGVAATAVHVASPSELEATAPAGTGKAEVKVTVGTETGSLPNAYTYDPVPTVESIAPEEGPTGGHTIVTIKGTGFTTGTTVKFGAKSGTVTFTSATEVTAESPENAVAHPVAVTVATAGGEAVSPKQFTYVAAPTVTGLSPEQGPEAGGTKVTIKGTGFTEHSTVAFAGKAATSIHMVSATELEAVTPEGKGPAEVIVTTGGGSGAWGGAFNYVPKPTIESVSPNEGPEAGGTPVVIKGKDLTGVIEVKFAGNPATKVEPMSATEIKAVAPAGTGTVKVTVTAAGGTGVAEAAFTYTKISVTGGGGGSTGTTTTTITPKLPLPIITAKTPVPPKFVRVPVPLVTQLHSRLVHGNKLEVRFHLAVKARVRLVARKGHKIVSQTKLLTLKGGARKLTLQLSRKRWPTKLELQTHALAALPTILQVG